MDEDKELFNPNDLAAYSELFDNLCQERWNSGAEEYGELAFLNNDIIRMLVEELIDTANYARMQAIKLLSLNDALMEQLKDTKEGHTLGAQSFRGTGESWNK